MHNIQCQVYNKKQKKVHSKALRISYFSLIFSVINSIVLYFLVGGSQAMWTNFIENIFNIVPPMLFLLSNHVCNKKPTQHYPYGFHRLVTVAFFGAALLLFLFGAMLLSDALQVLYTHSYPTIGLINIFGTDVWQGWLMILALAINVPIIIILSIYKEKLAGPLHDKVLFNDAKMNKADWLTNLTAICGIIGVGYGIWWADAVAAAIISLDILYDGSKQLKESCTELIDRTPKSLEGKFLALPQSIEKILLAHPLILNVEVCLREAGHIFCGQAFVELQKNQSLSQQELTAIKKEIKHLDLRILNFFIVVVKS